MSYYDKHNDVTINYSGSCCGCGCLILIAIAVCALLSCLFSAVFR